MLGLMTKVKRPKVTVRFHDKQLLPNQSALETHRGMV